MLSMWRNGSVVEREKTIRTPFAFRFCLLWGKNSGIMLSYKDHTCMHEWKSATMFWACVYVPSNFIDIWCNQATPKSINETINWTQDYPKLRKHNVDNQGCPAGWSTCVLGVKHQSRPRVNEWNRWTFFIRAVVKVLYMWSSIALWKSLFIVTGILTRTNVLMTIHFYREIYHCPTIDS